jgi:hypothetical protein
MESLVNFGYFVGFFLPRQFNLIVENVQICQTTHVKLFHCRQISNDQVLCCHHGGEG